MVAAPVDGYAVANRYWDVHPSCTKCGETRDTPGAIAGKEQWTCSQGHVDRLPDDVRRNVRDTDDQANEPKNVTGPKKSAKSVIPPRDILSALDAPLPGVGPAKALTDRDILSKDAAWWEAKGCRVGSSIAPENIKWLWPGRIPMGKLVVMEGDGGEGKSMILDDLAARLTAHLPMPDGSPNPFDGPVRVLLLACEDDPADTIIPRLIAAGGNPAYLVLLEKVPDAEGGHFPTIPDDLEYIEQLVTEVGVKLVAIDPLASYLSGDVNSNNDHSMRRALATVPEIAARTGATFAIVRHLNKNLLGDPKYRGSGAGSLVNLARIALAVGPDPTDETGERHALAVNKVNIDKGEASYAYHIETVFIDKSETDNEQIKTAKIVWDGPSTLTAADLFGAKPDEETRTGGEAAKEMVGQLLKDGEQDEAVVSKAILAGGASKSSYMRARKALGVQSTRVGGAGASGRWVLSLPAKDVTAKAAKDVTPKAHSDLVEPAKNVTNGNDTLSDILSTGHSNGTLPKLCAACGKGPGIKDDPVVAGRKLCGECYLSAWVQVR